MPFKMWDIGLPAGFCLSKAVLSIIHTRGQIPRHPASPRDCRRDEGVESLKAKHFPFPSPS